MNDSRGTGASSTLAVVVVAALVLLLGTLCHLILDGIGWGQALYETLYAIARMVAADDHGLSAGGRMFTLLSVLAGGAVLALELTRLGLRRKRGT